MENRMCQTCEGDITWVDVMECWMHVDESGYLEAKTHEVDPDLYEFSTNPEAERLFGLRSGGIPFDLPAELGFWCPVCRVPPFHEDGSADNRLHFSQYNCFMWCEVCNRDYPSVLCIRLDGEPRKAWHVQGIEAAMGVFMETVREAIGRSVS